MAEVPPLGADLLLHLNGSGQRNTTKLEARDNMVTLTHSHVGVGVQSERLQLLICQNQKLGAVARASPGTMWDKGSMDAWQQDKQALLLPTLIAEFQVSRPAQLLSLETLD